MAHLDKKKDGSFEITFYSAGSRSRITLGKKFSPSTAGMLLKVIEQLLFVKHNPDQRPEQWVLGWIGSQCEAIQDKLINAGLIVRPKTHTAIELWETYLKQKTGIKKCSLDQYTYAAARFFSFFDKDTELSEITVERMLQWKSWIKTNCPTMNGSQPADATLAGTISRVKAVFNWAVRVSWLDKSPMTGVSRGSFVNHDRDRTVTMDEYRRLLEVCPDQEWRTVLALARIGGLRCPSEVLQLRWIDVNWERGRLYIRSPKTESIEGKEKRLIPLFAGVREELTKLFESDASEGMMYVINQHRHHLRSFGVRMERLVCLAGIEPIPRPFDNMRASRSTEIYNDFNPYLESCWIGHSSKVAREHYLAVRDEDFNRALESEKSYCTKTEQRLPEKSPAMD